MSDIKSDLHLPYRIILIVFRVVFEVDRSTDQKKEGSSVGGLSEVESDGFPVRATQNLGLDFFQRSLQYNLYCIRV